MKWQDELRHNLRDSEELARALSLDETDANKIREELRVFPMSVPHYYFSLIDPEDPHDPIRKLCVPSGDAVLTEGVLDTSGEEHNTVQRGIQHKYNQTALVLVTSACAMYCRHCFRRRMVGVSDNEIAEDPKAAAGYIFSHPEINNCLLSGGDAFLLDTDKIREWLDVLCDIPQLDFIRFGTRTPVTFPVRINSDQELIRTLSHFSKRKQIYIITHFNHPREFTEDSIRAVRALQGAGVIVKNQTVLLRGVNDDPEVLGELLRLVSANGIVQHYVFQCRPVRGVKSSYQLPIMEGERIVREARNMQNGIGKSADYVMSHVTGKIRILGHAPDPERSGGSGDGMLFQYVQARDPKNLSRIFSRVLSAEDAWLSDDILEDI